MFYIDEDKKRSEERCALPPRPHDTKVNSDTRANDKSEKGIAKTCKKSWGRGEGGGKYNRVWSPFGARWKAIKVRPMLQNHVCELLPTSRRFFV